MSWNLLGRGEMCKGWEGFEKSLERSWYLNQLSLSAASNKSQKTPLKLTKTKRNLLVHVAQGPEIAQDSGLA